MRMYRHCILFRRTSNRLTTRLQAWLEEKPKLKVGNYLTLKDHIHPKWLWKIESIGEIRLPSMFIKDGRDWMATNYQKENK